MSLAGSCCMMPSAPVPASTTRPSTRRAAGDVRSSVAPRSVASGDAQRKVMETNGSNNLRLRFGPALDRSDMSNTGCATQERQHLTVDHLLPQPSLRTREERRCRLEADLEEGRRIGIDAQAAAGAVAALRVVEVADPLGDSSVVSQQ